MISRSGLAPLIAAHGLAEWADAIAAEALPSVRLIPTQPTEAPESRLGGLPDVPPDFEWPIYRGQPMTFLAQIRVDHLPGPALGLDLPISGLIAFFYDGTQSVFGHDVADRQGWRVFYFQSLPALRLWSGSSSSVSQVALLRKPVAPSLEWTLPQWPSVALDRTGLGRGVRPGASAALDAYLSLLEAAPQSPKLDSKHRLFGYPDQLQTDMTVECELVDATGTTEPRTPLSMTEQDEIAERAGRWKLLLQLDSDEDLGVMWGDGGRLYFWIDKSALGRGDYSAVHLIVQSL